MQKAPAVTIDVLARSLRELAGRPEHEIKVIGTRHGEKLYEVLLSREEMASAEDHGAYFRVPPDLRDLNYSKFVELGEARISRSEDYNSHNTQRLDLDGMKCLLQLSRALFPKVSRWAKRKPPRSAALWKGRMLQA